MPLREAPQPGGEDRYFVRTIARALAEEGTIFVGYDPAVATVNPRTRELLDAAVRDAGKRLRPPQIIADRQGRATYEILQAD